MGFGRFGRNHAQAIVNTEGAELAAVACRSDSSAREARAAFPTAEATTDYRDVMARDDVDVIDVALPTYLLT